MLRTSNIFIISISGRVKGREMEELEQVLREDVPLPRRVTLRRKDPKGCQTAIIEGFEKFKMAVKMATSDGVVL